MTIDEMRNDFLRSVQDRFEAALEDNAYRDAVFLLLGAEALVSGNDEALEEAFLSWEPEADMRGPSEA